MRNIKRLFYIILINISVSALTVLGVLYFWGGWGQAGGTQVKVIAINAGDAGQTTEAVDQAEGGDLFEVATDTPPPSLTPTPIRLIPYKIREGDTLGSIAVQFEISLADILAVNDIPDPDNVMVGQTVYVPSGPVPIPTDTLVPPSETPLSTSTPRPTPSPTLTATLLVTKQPSEVMIASVIGTGDITAERAVLMRTGEDILLLEGWILQDSDGHAYIFPQLSLFKGAVINVHTKAGQDTAVDLYWGLAEPVWGHGEIVILRDSEGNERARYTVP